ncbi:MAG: gamma-glutamylcyclotransferase, partial [Pirellulales bacterium]|nr:gamma-glutamylcyclotransferase [Pirellulales bacterium]
RLMGHGSTMVHVFCYGSNMCTARLRDRAPSAKVIAAGYVAGRRLAFHKRGRDGSAKANAYYTGRDEDRVWGVVFAIAGQDKVTLDDHEIGYESVATAVVVSERTEVLAHIYVAHADVVDNSLEPFCWYRQFLLHGAIEHALPRDYIDKLHAHDFVTDHDIERAAANRKLLVS